MARALRVGLPFFFIGPFMPLKRAQNERLRGPPPGCGALRLEPVARLYFFLPAAVSPPLRLLCLPILRETFLLRTLLRAIISGQSIDDLIFLIVHVWYMSRVQLFP